MRLFHFLVNTRDRIEWRRLSKRLDSLDRIRSRHPEFPDCRAAIRRAGTDNLDYFGNGYEHEGGLFLQQNPDEFAALCLLLEEHKPLNNYLEIGTASGGTARFLWNRFQFSQVLCLDDGHHPRADAQDRHLAEILDCHRYCGDSHAPAARRFLEQHSRDPIDIAFVDGDHRLEGVFSIERKSFFRRRIRV